MRSGLGWVVMVLGAVMSFFAVPRVFDARTGLDNVPVALAAVAVFVVGLGIKEDSRWAYGAAVLLLLAAAYLNFSPPL